MSAPEFYLPPCPVCSNILVVIRPIWRFAHNTARKRGVRCHILTGCRHAHEVSPGLTIHEEGDDSIGFVEDAWKRRAEELFAEMTAAWTPEQRDAYRRSIEDRHFIPGAVEALPGLDDFQPEPVAAGPDDEESPI